MKDICSLKDTEIDKIPFLFCYKCKNLLNKNSKRCNNLKCSKVFCWECSDITCSICGVGELKNNSFSEINFENLLFCCNKSLECKEQYTYEEKIKNHFHTNINNIKCNKCDKNLNQAINSLKCSKCNKYFCYKKLNYNPLLASKEKSYENCGIKCLKCFKYFCSLCDNNNKNNNKSICLNCSNIINKNADFNLKEKNKCNLCLINETWKNCSICNINICFACSNECENTSCKKIICINCSLFCNICKNIICLKCSIKCSSCPVNETLVSCIDCNSDAIIKCSIKNCNNKVCLNCLKYCNYCKEVMCNIHSLSCANCLETICPFHWHMCKKCLNNKEDFTKNKLCLKNCTKKCYFCSHEINLFCKEENHPDDFIKKYSCEHYICNTCVKKCDICKEPIKACIECEKENNYVHCRICDKSLCYYCSKKCTICGEHYCDETHKCFLCDMTISNDVCPNCDFIERTKCMKCSKNLFQCQNCTKLMICSLDCFNKHIKIKKQLNKNLMRSKTNQSMKSNVKNNLINNVFSLFQNGGDTEIISTNNNTKNGNNKIIIETDKGIHLCLMYYCEDHLNNVYSSQSYMSGPLSSRGEFDNDVRKYQRNTDKENIKCSSCNIF